MLRIDQPLFALGPFTSGAMLLWGLAAAVPIILHLLNRRRRRSVPFAAMQFLLAAQRQQSRRLRLWQWLLLLARVSAVLLIAAGLADPIFGERQPEEDVDAAPTLHVLVLDGSYSMQAASGDGDTRLWDLAARAALERVDRAAAGDAFCLVQMAQPIDPVIVRPVRNVQAVRSELQRMQPTDSGASLPRTLAVVQQLIQDARQQESSAVGRVQVAIFSDMQRATWTSIVQPEGRQAWDALAAIAEIEAVPVGQPSAADNLTVVRSDIASGIVAAGQIVELETEVRRSGGRAGIAEPQSSDAATGAQVQLKWEGQIRSSVRLPPLDAGDVAAVTLSTRLSAGETALEVETGSDALAVDNRRWVPLAVPERLRVVCIGDDQTTRYLAAAVAPRTGGPVEVQTVAPERVAGLDAAEIDVLMLCDLRQLTPAVNALVDRAAQSGAGVVWWLGASVDAAGYRRVAESEGLASLPVLPARPAAEAVYALDPRSYSHPIAAPFEAHPQSGLLSTPLFRYWIVTPIAEGPSGCDVALAAGEQGDPLLLTCETESHRIAVFTTAPSAGGVLPADASTGRVDGAPWNALVAWPSFVPLVQETLRWVIAPRLARPSLLVGQPLTGTVPKTLGRPTQLTMPDGSQRATIEVSDSGAHWRWSASLARQSGVYRVQTDRGRSRVLAVNVDPREGDLSRFDAAVPPPRQRQDRAAGDTQDAANRARAGDPWFRVLLAVAIGVLAVESLISRIVLGWERSS